MLRNVRVTRAVVDYRKEIIDKSIIIQGSGNSIINAIGFNIGNLADEYLIGDKVDILGLLEINTFNGRSSVQINIKDIMKSLK